MNRQPLSYLFMLFLFACVNNKEQNSAEEEALPPQYYYYPRANVYFDSANKNYLFSGSNDTSWQSAKQIPAVVQALMDKHVFIRNPADPVWLENENHKLVYSSLLYATANDTVLKKTPPKSVVKAPPPPPVDSSNMVRKERKGLGKLLNKLFGKKKKEPEDSGAAKQQ
jgi:hypothetical protein